MADRHGLGRKPAEATGGRDAMECGEREGMGHPCAGHTVKKDHVLRFSWLPRGQRGLIGVQCRWIEVFADLGMRTIPLGRSLSVGEM